MSQNLMLVPTLACPAQCSYCFGPHEGTGVMSQQVIEALIDWQDGSGIKDKLNITFHGGEPLAARASFYRMALPLLSRGLADRHVSFSVQSNLWLLDGELCDLFRAYRVSLGTSLDGPEAINDTQRGAGYFRRTMQGIERAQAAGLETGCICTLTRRSLAHIDEILEFFIREGLEFSLHAALPSLQYLNVGEWALSPEDYGEVMTRLLDRYVVDMDKMRISTLDALCRGVAARHGNICTFGDCLGGFMAVDPQGSIYPCQRFAGMEKYSMGQVFSSPSSEDLSRTATWRLLEEREQRIQEECGDCAYLEFCRGGCPYNVLAANGGSFNGRLRDPHCPAYRRIFSHIIERAMDEVFSQKNLQEVISQPDSKDGFLHHGRLLTLMRGGPHPNNTARNACLILAAAVLAEAGDPETASKKFEQLGLSTNPARIQAGMMTLHERLNESPTGLNNLYLHVTFNCPLECTHCYANAGRGKGDVLSVVNLRRACEEAGELGFRHAVITGGEPLVHPERDRLLDTLSALRGRIGKTITVLRTSLALPMDASLLWRLGHSSDQVVVSLDGDRETHDTRRGKGCYDLVVRNLRSLVEVGLATDLSLAAVLPLAQVIGAPGEAVRRLAKELGIRRTRFRPILPLGRALKGELDLLPEALWGHMEPEQMVAYGFTPSASCGMGQNLYVEPDGSAYPCYAWHETKWRLGDITSPAGLPGIIESTGFKQLKQHTVDTNRGCRQCSLRYLCGGACRAWNHLSAEQQNDLDAAPIDCTPLFCRARSLLKNAMQYLRITDEVWQTAGLILPVSPPAVHFYS